LSMGIIEDTEIISARTDPFFSICSSMSLFWVFAEKATRIVPVTKTISTIERIILVVIFIAVSGL